MIDLEARGLVRPASLPSIPDGPASMAELLEPMLAADPDRIVLVGRHARYTALELDETVRRAAGALSGLGIGPGDRVAASLPNNTDIVVAFLAAMRVGAIWVGINRPLAGPEKAYMLADSQTSVFLGDPDTTAQVAAERSSLHDLTRIVTIDPSLDDEWRTLVASADPERVDATIDRFAPAAIAYTSGTTGFPKGAVHIQHNLMLPGAVARQRPSTGIGGVNGVALPLTVLNLIVLGPLLAYQCDMSCVAMDRIDGIGQAEWIESEGITSYAAVPAMVHDLLTNPAIDRSALRSLDGIGVGGADMPDAFRRLYIEAFGKPCGTGYGLTEAPTTVTQEDPDGPIVPDSCGKALPHVTIHVLADDGRPVETGEVGEICIGPTEVGPFADCYRPMLGYWNRPDETAAALSGGLLHTGDLGTIDADGNVSIKDRRNDLIIRGGANVYPAEVERIIHDEPAVAACAVIGVPDERLGERVVAFVQPAEGAMVDTEALLARCATNLARYKVPERIELVDDFDRTPMGKIRKTVLRDRV